MKIFLKIIKYSSVFLISILLILTMFFQYKAEKYLSEVDNKYGLFKDKERISYTPFLVFYLYAKTDKDFYLTYSKYLHYPYKEKGLSTKYLINNTYGTYFIYCYFTKEELSQKKD